MYFTKWSIWSDCQHEDVAHGAVWSGNLFKISRWCGWVRLTPAGWLVHGRRQLWRWENYITHISAVIAYSNGNPLGSMGLNEEADMWELVATAWIGPSLGWRRFCGMQNSVSMQPRMGKYMEIRFLFLSGFPATRVSEWQRLQHGICMLGTFAQYLLSILISMQLQEPGCSLRHEAVT